MPHRLRQPGKASDHAGLAIEALKNVGRRCEAVMERDLELQSTDPSGALVERVAEHVAAAHQLIQASRNAVARATVQIQQSHDRVGRTNQPRHDSAGRARAAHRSATAAGQRYLQAKQRELAAHDRAILRHIEAAEFQQRLGHPDRAANARTHAQHARELRQQALQELNDWLGQTPADQDRPAPAPS
jgi:hypothetical protein